jgi:hypothetical protein
MGWIKLSRLLNLISHYGYAADNGTPAGQNECQYKKENMQEIRARMETNEAKLEANRNTVQEHMQDILSRMGASRK